MLWLALFAPKLPFDLLARQGHPTSRPAALLGEEKGIPRLAEVNAAAARRGLRPGQSLAHAYAVVPALLLLRRDEAAERAALERLASCALGFSSEVRLAERAVLLEVGGSLRLFGGLEALGIRLREALEPLAMTLREGVAPTAEAALFLARAGGGRILSREELEASLAPLRLSAAPLPSELIATLGALGLDRLGRLFRLPSASLGERFGPALSAWLESLLGERPPAWPRFTPPERFQAELELPQPAGSVPELRFALARLVHELTACLAPRRLGVAQLRLTLKGRRSWRDVTIALRSPSAEAKRLLAAAEAALERIELSEPVLALALESGSLREIPPLQQTLWGPASEGHQERLAELIERLEQRLGEAALYRLGLAEDHRPERAFRRLPAWPEPQPGKAAPPPSPRPAWFLPSPRPVRREDYELLSGPERIESGWWDGEEHRRDYYRARDRQGRECWLFQAAEGWFLQGFFR